MNQKLLGTLAAAAVVNLLSQGAFAAGGKDKADKKDIKPSAKCVHNCNGYAMCKGNGNASCKGQNGCANTGLVPVECSSKKTEDECIKVVDKKNEKMCTWS